MSFSINKKYTSYLLLVVSCVSFISATFFLFKHVAIKKNLYEKTKNHAHYQTQATAQKLEQFIHPLKQLVVSLADALSNKKLFKKEIEEWLQKKPVEVSGFGVAFAPYAFDAKTELFAPYFVEQEGKQVLTQLNYDYTQEQYDWYHQPIKQGPSFYTPFDQRSDSIVLQFAAPFYSKEEKTGTQIPAGIVYATQTREHIAHVLSTLFLGQTGYWFILAQDGTILIHPNEQLVKKQITLAELAQEQNSHELNLISKQVSEGKKGFVEYDNELTSTPSFLFVEPIPSPKWTLCGVFDKEELFMYPELIKKNYLFIVLSILSFVIFFALWILTLTSMQIYHLWIVSFVLSIALTCAIGIAWYLSAYYPSYQENLRIIKNKVDLYTFLDEVVENKSVSDQEKKPTQDREEKHEELSKEMLRYLTYRYSEGIFIPTGIFISDINLSKPETIDLVCYIWQRYSLKRHQTIERGFILPQASSATISELHRTRDKNTETIVWQVKCSLNQSLTYSQYPFDVKDFQIQLWHKNFDKKDTAHRNAV